MGSSQSQVLEEPQRFSSSRLTRPPTFLQFPPRRAELLDPAGKGRDVHGDRAQRIPMSYPRPSRPQLERKDENRETSML